MNQPHSIRLSAGARLVGLVLLLGLGVFTSLGLATRPAHAQPAATTTITTCDESHLDAAITNAASGDTISFGCSGDILLSSTLVISKNLTLSGSGQSVTLDGNNSVQVLSVGSGVSFTLDALTIAHGVNPGGYGGGLENGGTVSISNSTFANNSALNAGGLENGGTMSISNSTFANNSASGLGNGFDYGGGLLNIGTMSISNSTFANNSATRAGGGLFNDGGTMSISNSTFANNSASDVGGGLLNQGRVNIGGSIVANNTGGDCVNDSPSFTDNGYNLDSDTSCFTSPTSLHGNPQLAALASNGGPTQTMAVQQGSPAIDQIPTASCPQTDQRGVSRPDTGESTCDIGAYEFSDPVDKDLGLSNLPANITTDATSPQGADVTYTPPVAVDEDSPLPTVICDHASGSTFAIGTTTVTCTVSDSDDTNSPVSASFMVTVNGAATQIGHLISLVNSFHLADSLQNALDVKLSAALKAITAGQTATACSDLSDFIGQVQAQTGKGITASQASQLIAAAKQVQAVLGC